MPGTISPRAASGRSIAALAAAVVERLGGRYSTELGIDLDAGDAEVERWFLAATLFGAPISARAAARTFDVLEGAGVRRIADVESRTWDSLVELLDAGGYTRYDFRTATRLQALARLVADRYGGEVSEIGRRFTDPSDVSAALDELPGWGPVTVGLFLRELRGVWPGARLPIDARAADAARHLGLVRAGWDPLVALARISEEIACDERDLEAALVRLSLAHRRVTGCPGGRECVVLADRAGRRSPGVRTVPLPGARTLTIRHVRAADAAGLRALYEGLSEDDTYRRFFSGRPPPPPFVEQMTRVSARGGVGLVATIGKQGGPREIVAEASYELLPDGDGELGITVAEDARGWLGPYLLDALVEEAAARGVPNLQAEVLLVNGRMLTTLRSRGFAIVSHAEGPAVVRVTIGTSAEGPSWPGSRRPRLLVEAAGGRWHAEDAARAAGFQVLACPGPRGGWAACPAMRGEQCPLAASADVIVEAVPGDVSRPLVDAHQRLHPWVPICVEVPAREVDSVSGAVAVPRGTGSATVVGILQRLAQSGSPGAPGAGPGTDQPEVSRSVASSVSGRASGRQRRRRDVRPWGPSASPT